MRRQIAILSTLLVGILSATPVIADELTIYAMPSAYGLNWDTPQTLLRSRLKNELTLPRRVSEKRKMGHVMVELKTSSGVHILTGMAATSDAVKGSTLLTKEKVGLGILSYSFKGRMESKAELEPELADRYRRGAISFARFEISPQTGERLARYVKEYRERGYYRQYGGSNRPLHGEGAGCSAFGVSFLELAGLMTPELRQQWSRNVALPTALTGGSKTGRRVPLRKLLLGNAGKSWAKAGEPQVPFSIYDPQLIHEWILRHTKSEASRFGWLRARTEKRGRARGISVDARHVRTPTESIWRGAAARYHTRAIAKRTRRIPTRAARADQHKHRSTAGARSRRAARENMLGPKRRSSRLRAR